MEKGDSKMSWVVYVNKNTDATIHKSVCRKYLHRKANTSNGFWSGVFQSYNTAQAYAQKAVNQGQTRTWNDCKYPECK